MFKEFDGNGVENGKWTESINGVDNEFFFEFNKKQIYAAMGKDDTELKSIDEKDKIVIQIDQVKLIQYQVSANNQYKYTMMQRKLAGGNLGNTSAQGRLIFRDGLENTIEYIKRELFKDGGGFSNFRTSIGSNSVGGRPGEFVELLGFEDAETLANNNGSISYQETDFSKIKFTQLPSFNISIFSKKSNSSAIKSKNIIKNVRFVSIGDSSSIEDLEQNTIAQFKASNVTGWVKV